MGLCIFSGPSWEDDSLNKINPESIIENAYMMMDQRVPYHNSTTQKETLPSFYRNRETD